jgi:hypothetical protein
MDEVDRCRVEPGWYQEPRAVNGPHDQAGNGDDVLVTGERLRTRGPAVNDASARTATSDERADDGLQENEATPHVTRH